MSVDEVVARWRAEEEAVRGRLSQSTGFATLDQVEGQSGMQWLQALLAGQIPRAPIGDTLDFVPIHVEPGSAVFQGRPMLRHYNPLGVVHGGWFATLLDSAMGCAVHSTMPADKAYTTLELKLNFVRALSDAVPLVRAHGTVVHSGRQVATAEGRLTGPDGKLYAHGTTTCLILDRPPSTRR